MIRATGMHTCAHAQGDAHLALCRSRGYGATLRLGVSRVLSFGRNFHLHCVAAMSRGHYGMFSQPSVAGTSEPCAVKSQGVRRSSPSVAQVQGKAVDVRQSATVVAVAVIPRCL